jgi:hypothetical protein
MAVTFHGTVKTLAIVGNDATTQNLFVIENGFKSRVNVVVRRLLLACDSLVALTSVQNLASTSRCSAVSGGVLLEKGAFNTSESSDANVMFRAQANETALITATQGDIIWRQFIGRMHTAVEQQQPVSELETLEFNNMLPVIVKTLDFVIRPGESLLIRVSAGTTASNAQNSTNYIVDCAWEEQSVTTFAISGTVTLSGSPLDGAKVMVVEADNTSLTNAYLYEVKTTAGGGLWSSTIRTGKVGAAFVQYENGGTYYTAPGSPFLQQ